MIGPDFSPEIIHFETLDSTNSQARKIALKGGAEGTVVTARTQTAGRGRGKRTWHSPEGGLYLSVLLNSKDPKRPTDLAILAGAAVAQAVKDCLPKQLDVTVKWPNDCLIGWKKVGGVLSEGLGEELELCVVGIGINVNVPDTELEPYKKNPFSATSFLAESGGNFDIEWVKKMVLAKLFTLYRLYHQQGFMAVKEVWQRNCHFIGKKVELSDSGSREGDRVKSGPGVIIGKFAGIDDRGAIVLSNQKGEEQSYYSGEITCFWP